LVGWAPHPIPAEEIAERCFLAMLNEIAFTIMDGVIENPKDIDIGVIFGFGFPPFRGGILREADRQGIDRIVARLEHYAGRHGARFTPAGLLVDMAKKGARFHAG
jgi:3-hydroxyacyl-CoA dehydrogenase/enoyl-CoA hydratase/3-hydroxybutyryl-CoA epimerase